MLTGVIFALSAVISCSLHASAQCRLAGSPNQPVIVTGKDDGKKVGLEKSERLIVKLEARPGTGYSWRVTKNDPAKLKQEGAPTVERPDNDKLDGVEYQVFCFTGVSGGIVRLEMDYRRPWEKDAAPAKTFGIDVQIRQ
jgi:inhibitor of cysteine peptidase